MNEGDKRPRLSLVKGLRGRIEDIERQMAHLEAQRRRLDGVQRALAEVETLLRRMAALAREAAQTEDPARRGTLSAEFEACKRRTNLIAQNAGPDGQHLLADDLAAVRALVEALDRELDEV